MFSIIHVHLLLSHLPIFMTAALMANAGFPGGLTRHSAVRPRSMPVVGP